MAKPRDDLVQDPPTLVDGLAPYVRVDCLASLNKDARVSVHMSDMDHPRYFVLNQLNDLVTGTARQPELLFVAIGALGDEMERLGMVGKDLDRVRESARGVRNMVGCSADYAWDKLGRRERFRNRKREKEWKREHTESLLAAARQRVNEILADQ